MHCWVQASKRIANILESIGPSKDLVHDISEHDLGAVFPLVSPLTALILVDRISKLFQQRRVFRKRIPAWKAAVEHLELIFGESLASQRPQVNVWRCSD